VVLLARTLAYIDVLSLNRDGKLFFPDLIRALVEKYSFQKFPQTLEELDLKKGIEFFGGKSGTQPIQKFGIWSSLLVVETVSGTDESKSVIHDILEWGSHTFGMTYCPSAIIRYAYVSDVTFHSDAPILSVNPATDALCKVLGDELSTIWQEPLAYQTLSLKFGHDPASRPFNIAPFSIERKGDTRFSENKYFSEAPLPTKVHLKLLEEFEMNMLLSGKAGNV
jgi:hypothetical protein